MVTIHYTLTVDSGEVIDSSKDGDPLTYLHRGGLIPGLENELEGRKSGDAFQATIQPAEAYGESDPTLVREVPLDVLSEIDNLEIGMRLQSQDPQGRVQLLVVEAIGDESATLNANHPLAGEILHFDVSVESVREATDDDLAQRS